MTQMTLIGKGSEPNPSFLFYLFICVICVICG